MRALLTVLNKYMMNTSFILNQKLYNLHVFIIMTTNGKIEKKKSVKKLTKNDKEWIENNRKTDKGDKIFKIGKNLIYNKNVMPLKKPKKNREPIFYIIHTYLL